MRRATTVMPLGVLALVAAVASVCGADGPGDHGSCVTCTGSGPCCEPRCKAEWGEAKTKKPTFSIKCEYACARGRDSWHAPDPDCRCRPPCGEIYVKKRLYKTEGEEKIERVPKYEVEMVAAEPCGCRSCRGCGSAWWNPLEWPALSRARCEECSCR